jgi:hypothetical protein
MIQNKLKLKIVSIFLYDLKLWSFSKLKCKIWEDLHIFKKFISIQPKKNMWCIGEIINNLYNILQKKSF